MSVGAIKSGFGDYGEFPGCLGAIDCTKIKIKKPSIDEDAYVSRHPGHYINSQAICDHRLKFVDAVVRWPGSVNDSVIWDHSGFKEELEGFLSTKSKDYQGWLLGDSGYSQRIHMMVPFLEAETSAQERYNSCHKKSRCVIERSFGCLKSRFRCLCKDSNGAIMFEPDVACAIIISCMVIHNYCIDRNFPMTVDGSIIDNMRDSSSDKQLPTSTTSDKKLTEAGFLSRQSLTEKHFSKRKRSVQ